MTDNTPPASSLDPPPRIPARAAAVRGDNYQYAVAWHYLCRALTDPGVDSVSIEDAQAGQFDDVAVRFNDGRPDEYFQVKSSNSGDKAITNDWLTTAPSKTGRSPLQHYYRTWASLAVTGRPFQLTFLTNRGFDHEDPILGALRDNYDSRIRTHELRAAAAGSAVGMQREVWLAHLGSDVEELVQFLDAVRWQQASPDETLRENVKPLMRLAGLRDDNEAVEVGIAIARDLVMRGAGPQRTDAIRRTVDQRNLLASSAQLILAVNAIDRPASLHAAQVTLDWVDRFSGNDPWSRHHTTDPNDWTALFPTNLAEARASLESYSARRVLVVGASRLSTHFAIGKELADVRHWVLAANQRGQIWATDVPPEPEVLAAVVTQQTMGSGTDLAVGISLSGDPTDDVISYVQAHQPSVGTVLILGPGGTPDQHSVLSNGWLTAWINHARASIRRAARSAHRIHLFINAPACAALILGHSWNAMPAPTTVYDFDSRVYFPTFQFS